MTTSNITPDPVLSPVTDPETVIRVAGALRSCGLGADLARSQTQDQWLWGPVAVLLDDWERAPSWAPQPSRP